MKTQQTGTSSPLNNLSFVDQMIIRPQSPNFPNQFKTRPSSHLIKQQLATAKRSDSNGNNVHRHTKSIPWLFKQKVETPQQVELMQIKEQLNWQLAINGFVRK
jgi:hypothetical protein